MSASATLPEVRVAPRARRRLDGVHPWIFRDDVVDGGGAGPGDLVRVRDDRGALRGLALWSSRSKIALRRVTRADVAVDASFWDLRVEAAIARRGSEVASWSARRLLFGESDGTPGLVADLYGSHLVVQTLTAGAERILPDVLASLRARLTIDSVLARNDPAVRTLEGLSREVVQLDGTTPDTIAVDEAGVTHLVDPWRGQKTGAFLDQRENRVAAGALARGRVLDAFAYHASFGLHAARRAAEVVVVDSSKEALARGRAAAERNGAGNLSFVEAAAFDELRARERAGERFDVVMIDPPAFAKSRSDVPAARRGYREINLRALRLLAPGGVLVTSSCSGNLDEAAFEEVLVEALAGSGRTATIAARRGQAADHPALLGFPESRYLKCFFLREGGGAA
ncbi:MAG TPA: class I SAM-dependent rRNA methyltransferase [Candidatus Bathyarchaeia archaeon]|nr:class I SAM-dependent rRNA methyltransferase [Candidatus Bathyarchaeia archaeon]